MRSFLSQDFIHLPPLGEAGTLTLVEELEEVARSAPALPSAAKRALIGLLEITARLKQAIAARERAGSPADPKARAADRVLDDAWGAFQSWLLGWTRLPEHAHARIIDAKRLYASLFPKGLQFLTLDYKDEWTESKNRLEHIAAHRLDDLIHELGGGPFLAQLARAHQAYGEALHITGAASTPEPDAIVRRALYETHLALREYVAQVAATVRRNDRSTVELAARLLAPLSARAFDEEQPPTLLSPPPAGARPDGP
jgi:hypothetical protein